MLWNNPIFIRYCRSELRVKKALFWYLLTFIVTAFTVSIIYVPQVVRGQESVVAARAALLPVLIIQGILLIFMGTGSVASGITREKVDNVLNYQRLTPLPVNRKILGYLLGLPVREYVLFAITLPFLVFLLIAGRIPPGAFIPYYIVFFSSALLYHLTGMVAGMISRKWRWSARISQGLIILLYFVLPQLSHVGLVFLEFLTVRPVFAEKILPLVGGQSGVEMSPIGFMAGKSVPLFAISVSGTVFSFLIQLLLILLFSLIVARKWHADSIPSFSKKMALATFLGFFILCVGNLWPNLTRSENALAIFQSDGDLQQGIAVAVLPLILALSSTALALMLMISALPDPMQFRQGQIRAERLGHERLSAWEDEASGYRFTFLISLIQVAFLSLAFFLIFRAGYFEGLNSHPVNAVFPILATVLFVFYFQGLKENFGGGQLALLALLHWLLPILAGILVIAINTEFRDLTLLIVALSPLSMLPLSTTMLVPPEELREVQAALYRSLGLGYLLLIVLNIFLHLRLRQIRSRKATVAISKPAMEGSGIAPTS